MNSTKVLLATLAAGSMLALAACSGGAGGGGEGDGGLIGVSMPTKSSERWIQDGDAVKNNSRSRASASTSSTPRTTSPRSRRSRT